MSRRPTIPLALLGLFALATLVVFLRYPSYPNYDSQYSLVWGREILDGIVPSFDAYRAPTEHPLLIAISVPLALLGDDAALRAFVAVCMVSLVLLVAAMYRLGAAAAGMLGGLAAAAIIASRLNFWLLASIGFLDLPYCAFVAWALALEVERPRRGGPVFVLLTLAGLLRPEAWVLTFLYAAWFAWPLDRAGRVRAFAYACVAPGLWCLVDLVVTGDLLFSIHHTSALAEELVRERPLHTLPSVMVRLLAEILKWPLLALSLAGVVAAWRTRRRVLATPAALCLVTCATYLVIASGGLATVYRYLLTAALALAVFGAYALTGWTTLDRGRPRQVWAATATVLVAFGALFTLTHTSPKKAEADLRLRAHIHHDLARILRMPEVRAARRCGPVSTANHKLMPDIRWLLHSRDGSVVARSDRRHGHPSGGVALIIERRYENRSALNVHEVPADDYIAIQTPPAGFRHVGGNRTFGVWVGDDC